MPYFLLVTAIMCIAVASALGLWLKLKSYSSLALLDFSLTFVVLTGVGVWLMDRPLAQVLPVSLGTAAGLTALVMLVRVVDRRLVEPRMTRRSTAH